MVVLQVLALIIGVVSAVIGFSEKAFYLLNPKIIWLDNSFFKLQAGGEITDRTEVRELLYFTRGKIARWAELPEMENVATMKRWSEAVKIVVKLGQIDQLPEKRYAAIHPIYGYNSEGQLCLAVGLREFHYLYSDRVRSLQQSEAFGVLIVSFLIQLVAILFPF